MKVYVVLGCLDREEECDRHIHGVFETSEKAIGYAIKIGREAFDKCDVHQNDREYVILDSDSRKNYGNGIIAWVEDIENYMVEVFVYEMEMQ